MNKIRQIYQTLLKKHGKQGWWPINGKYSGKSKFSEKEMFEICVGAILTQNTAWKNVEKALARICENKAYSPKAIASLKTNKLERMIKSSGYFRQKTKKLQILAKHIIENHKGSTTKMLDEQMPKLRKELLSLWGIGPETADSIILYAAQKPIFVIDTYTKRMLAKLRLCRENSGYEELQKMFMNALPPNTELFKEYHALIVAEEKNNAGK